MAIQQPSSQARIGIIGGSGLYQMEGLENPREVQLDTPFGPPSDAFILGSLCGERVAFLARHGRGHQLLPGELPFQANIYAMKLLGVEYIISASAVGSLKEHLRPRDIVLPDQFVDRTKARPSTFFGEGLVAHISFDQPICPQLSRLVIEAARSVELPETRIHQGGTYVCIEGPAFSTLAESRLYRSWDMDIIGMTNLQEAKLAREAEIAYVTLALVTDYDCWHPDHSAVSVEMILDNLRKNADNARRIIRAVVEHLHDSPPASASHSALQYALLTRPQDVPIQTRQKLAALLHKYPAYSANTDS
ncbi:MAG: S-methyl-5'-thioadenosine phosphorylase [Gemmatimonadaceae bacterium]|nr:S-methyl-5'-thioadenosine phosphorylase [Gloeobacterales cyanobacterium ES-bin-141]